MGPMLGLWQSTWRRLRWRRRRRDRRRIVLPCRGAAVVLCATTVSGGGSVFSQMLQHRQQAHCLRLLIKRHSPTPIHNGRRRRRRRANAGSVRAIYHRGKPTQRLSCAKTGLRESIGRTRLSARKGWQRNLPNDRDKKVLRHKGLPIGSWRHARRQLVVVPPRRPETKKFGLAGASLAKMRPHMPKLSFDTPPGVPPRVTEDGTSTRGERAREA